ncbi:hypothetical protein PFISCL1PPCAC_24570, partial [Pristionchus fissidentatus]
IEFDNSYGVFMPGCEVAGTVVMAVREATKAKSVLITVHGGAHTHWSVSEPRTRHVTRTNAQGQMHTVVETYYVNIPYTASVAYADGTAVLWTPPVGESTGYIQPGNYRYPFRFLLPANCPASFEGSFGYIRYYCKARIDRPWYKVDHKSTRVFTVNAISDLNAIPSALSPVQMSQSKETGVLFFKNGRINLTAKIHKGGFVPGEAISLQADIVNSSSQKIKKVRVKIVQCSHYVAYRGHEPIVVGGHPHGVSGSAGQKVDLREVFRSEEKVEIVKGASQQFTRLVPIPPVVNTFNNCPIITVSYLLKIKLTTGGAISTTLSAQLPLIIGSVPLRTAPPMPQSGPAPGAPPLYPQIPDAPPPSYAACVFGAGKIKDEDENAEFTPRYPYYPNITPAVTPSAPPLVEVEKM